MPLIHSKRPAAFKHNIETEMEHGKPQKQAVAIAYKEAGEHKAKGGMMCAHGGPVHCDMGCYAEGGDVDRERLVRQRRSTEASREGENTGVHAPSYSSGTNRGQSESGDFIHGGPTMGAGKERAISTAKDIHREKLSELKSMKGPHGNYAEGGEVEHDEPDGDEDGAEIHKMLGEELSRAIDSKDHKGMHDSIEAIIENCLSKKGGM